MTLRNEAIKAMVGNIPNDATDADKWDDATEALDGLLEWLRENRRIMPAATGVEGDDAASMVYSFSLLCDLLGGEA